MSWSTINKIIIIFSIVFTFSVYAADSFKVEVKYPKDVAVGDEFKLVISIDNDESSFDISNIYISIGKDMLSKIQVLRSQPPFRKKLSIPIPHLDEFRMFYKDELIITPGKREKIIIYCKAIRAGSARGKLRISAWASFLNPFKTYVQSIQLDINP